jgi:esterase/lipase
VRKFAAEAKKHEDDYVAYAAKLAKSGTDKTLRQAKSEATRLNKRNVELDTIINRMYEDYALGTITVERYQAMASKYEQEQIQVRERLDTLTNALTAQESQQDNNIRFLKAVRQYTEAESITRQMLVELIEKIVIFNGNGKGKDRDQQIDIYYRIKGLVDSKA